MIIAMSWIILSVFFFAIGEYLSKKWALHPSIGLIISIVVMYALGTLAWLPAIYKEKTLSIIGVIWMLLSLVATLFVGIFVFGEKLTLVHVIGIVFAFISVILLSL